MNRNKLIITIINVVLITLFISCSKDGCEDDGAWNSGSDSNCVYTKAIFYAGSNKVGGNGNLITKIEVYRRILNNDELIGVITNLEAESPAPNGCTVPNMGIEYKFSSTTVGALFTTKYFFENGVEDTGETYEISTSSSNECSIHNLTL